MLELEALVLREIHLPLLDPFVSSAGVQNSRRIALLELRTRDGYSAWSECVAQGSPYYSSETVDTAWFAITEWLAPILTSKDKWLTSDVLHQFDAAVRGHVMAKAAVEMACWNLDAQRREVSLAELIGGTQTHIPAGVAMGIPTGPESAADGARRLAKEGYRKIKLKVKPGADIDLVAAARQAVGDVMLAVDANGAYSLNDADHLRELDDYGLAMIEQPLHRDDMVRHAALQQQLRTPICLDESITSIYRVEEMIRLGSGGIVNVKPGRVGGLGPAIAIHDLCRRNDVPVWVGGMLETGIGRAYNVALASLPNFTLPADISPSSRYWERDVVVPPWTMSPNGYVEVPFHSPGIGVDVDVDRIDDLTSRRQQIEL